MKPFPLVLAGIASILAALTPASVLAQIVTRGPYLQNATPNAVTVRWRTDVATASLVNFGTSAANLDQHTDVAVTTTEHEVRLTGLAPGTQYYYEVGWTDAVLATGPDFTFTTPPVAGSQTPTRIWVIGDAGTGGSGAAAVRDGFATFNGTQHVDAWLMLGDNAYGSGTDTEYQAGVFNMYPAMLRRTLLWSTIGNHEVYSSEDSGLTFPYLDIFTLPKIGEAGGVPSGTEKYYSFDYGPIHFICLDSMSSNRSRAGAMAQWLRADLEATTQKWIVAFWHHPPYSKGSHDSDSEEELIEMREYFLPVLEAGGVDLVLSGHSHQYERSKLLNGHYHFSSELDASMVLDAGSGQETGTGAYRKPVIASSANQGAVYVVAGSSGSVGQWTDGSSEDVNPTPHPVMYASLARLGSAVLDVNLNRLDVKFISSTGTIDDSFTILKDIPNVPPTVTIASPAEGTVFAENADIAVMPDAQDAGTIVQADFYADDMLIRSDITEPFSVQWNDVPVGNYVLTVAVTDDLGATTVSAPVNISVIVPPPIPPVPLGLTATTMGAQVALSWTAASGAASYTLRRASSSGGPFTVLASDLTATSFTDIGILQSGVYYYTVSASNLGGESDSSTQASDAVLLSSASAATGGAVSGEPAGTVFRTFGVPGINDAGQLAFLSTLSTGSAILAGNPPVVIARIGGDAPGIAGAKFSRLKTPLLNTGGKVAFLARVRGAGVGTVQDEGIWTDRGGSLSLAAREGGEPPGVSQGRWQTFHSIVLGDDLLAFTATMASGPRGTLGPGGVTFSNDTGLWIADATTTTLALREGQLLTVAGGRKRVKSFVALEPGSIGRGHGYRAAFAEVLARVTFSDGSQTVFSANATGLTEVVAGGSDAPGYAAGSKFLSFGVPTPSGDGTVFRGQLLPGTGSVTAANSAAIFVKDGTGIVPVVFAGGNAPGLDAGVTFIAFKDPIAAPGLRTAWLGTVAGGTVTPRNDQGIWWRDGSGTISLVARESGAAPGVGTVAQPGIFASFKSLALPVGGAPLFSATLRVGAAGTAGPGGVLPESALGLWTVDSTGVLRLVLREQQTLAGKTVKTFAILSAVDESAAQTRSFNNAGQVVARIYFTDKTQAVVTIALP